MLKGDREMTHDSLLYRAFDPTPKADTAHYRKYVELMNTIHDVLDECSINIKTHGYTYIHDAICIITDYNSFDVCLNKDIYPCIATKHRVSGISSIEHNIRNAITSAYESGEASSLFMNEFSKKPSNKKFLLAASKEVHRRTMIRQCDY